MCICPFLCGVNTNRYTGDVPMSSWCCCSSSDDLRRRWQGQTEPGVCARWCAWTSRRRWSSQDSAAGARSPAQPPHKTLTSQTNYAHTICVNFMAITTILQLTNYFYVLYMYCNHRHKYCNHTSDLPAITLLYLHLGVGCDGVDLQPLGAKPLFKLTQPILSDISKQHT